MIRLVGTTLGQMLLVVAVASAFGLTFNQFRAKKGLHLGKDYLTIKTPGIPIKEASTGVAAATTTDLPDHVEEPKKGSVDLSEASLQLTARDDYEVGEHGFQEVSTEQVTKLYNDPRREEGAILFVDARNDDSFAEGRIPGAIQMDHYYVEQFMPEVMPLAGGAEIIVVYCGGGDCEDSIHACNDLIDESVPWDKLVLYKQGFTGWKTTGLPIEAGS